MRKSFAAPDFRKAMTVKPGIKRGKDAREVLNIDGCQMVIPNTYEKSKFKTDTAEAAKEAKARLVAQAKLEKNENEKFNPVDLTHS